MATFHPPLRDYQFLLNELFSLEEHGKLPGFADFTPDVVTQVLEEAAKFATEVVFPLNHVGDEEGCTLKDGQVITPRGFKDAYHALCEGGWPSLTGDPSDGGQGMPHMVNFLFEEMVCGANMAFGLFPGLTRGTYVAIKSHGSAEQRRVYAPKLASGEWAGAMCLTEAHAGSDLGLLKTHAVPKGDGSYSITGTKIFISAGEHDFTTNIIYLVLAKLPDASQGTKGISLFLVPKVMVNDDGTLGLRNRVSCGSLEKKMGIHGCPTCVMNFDGATGWLMGEPHQGLKAMFSMMNAERIAVGIQGLAIGEASYQNAVAYARDRLQGRAAKGPVEPSKPADPIIVHPDVRRMLLTQKALIEGARALALWTAESLDQSERHPDPAARERAEDFVALMTPVVKAFLTDTGSQAANLGMQVFGGHGYIRDNGQEQYARDARITQIYEGTNGIQALDLAGRKLFMHNGRLLKSFAEPVMAFLAAAGGNDQLAEFASPVAEAFGLLTAATRAIAERAAKNPEEVGAAAVDYLRLFALTATAFLWARAAEVSLPRANDDFYRGKLATARFFMQRLLPETKGLHAAIMAGAAPIMEIDAALF